jgi:hypothetical protein
VDILSLVIIGFIILESANVLALYFNPDTRKFNGVGVFKAWEESKAYPDIHRFVRYLVYWVAGTKLIFILLLGVILVSAGDDSKLLAAAALAIAIASFFWRLFPLIRKMDRDNQIEPPDYSKVLGLIILAFIVVFLVALAITLLT